MHQAISTEHQRRAANVPRFVRANKDTRKRDGSTHLKNHALRRARIGFLAAAVAGVLGRHALISYGCHAPINLTAPAPKP